MKNFIILLSLFIISCSNDNNSNSENTEEGTILKSYKSSDGNEHFFENNGARYEKILVGNNIFSKYMYDSNNKMTQIIYSPNDSNSTTTSFSYNDKGEIVKMEKDTRNIGSIGKISVWLYTYGNNIITGELVSNADPNYNHNRIRYTFNSQGLLISVHDYIENVNTPIVTNLYITFKYDDNNKNLITLKLTKGSTHDLPDSPVNLNSSSITYEYDDKTNPMHQIYMNHYLNYILSNDYPFNLERGNFQDRVLGTGTNNLIRTIYSIDGLTGGTPIDNIYINKYTYQLNDLPKKMGRVSTEDNKEYGSIIYNYITK